MHEVLQKHATFMVLGVALSAFPMGVHAQEEGGNTNRALLETKTKSAEEAALPQPCKDALEGANRRTKCWTDWSNSVSVGAGIPALSIRFDGKIGFLDQVAPIEIAWNRLQRRDINLNTGERSDWIFWRIAVGIRIFKRTEPDEFGFGMYVQPWGLRLNNFAAGIAIGYEAAESVTFEKTNFSILIPVTYTINF